MTYINQLEKEIDRLEAELASKNAHLEQVEAELKLARMDNTLESSYRDGYQEGYHNGGDDCASYECGSGSKHSDSKKRDEDEGWRNSEWNKALTGGKT
jgi:hypothetical protein